MGEIMLNFLDQLKALIIRTKEKLSEPVTAPRRKVIVVGVSILIIILVAYIL
jgi:hypothetical protein|tara:strand:- start:84 stop:239 length:156 start_codon:yes stop_codon:yes gene_type:complete